ncbi:MAG TPA: THUMP domain-containing protein [Thermoplasmata archaeon]|nr:THUMP domain-containing protein [Thermoplasmata archaeon]
MATTVLVRYGELALKSPPVRREFESALRRNILDQFVREGIAGRLRSDRGHLYVEADDADHAVKVLRRVFGVTSVSVVHEVTSDPGAIRERLLVLADPKLVPGATFAVRARRTGQHPFTSQELARDLGEAVLERFPDRHLTVDLEQPAVELFVEVRGPRTYLYFDRFEGPGGLPLGVAGRLVALVDGTRGALGAYLMMKRGCRVGLVVVPDSESLARGVLLKFDPSGVVERADRSPERWVPALAALADRSNADGVVLPLTVDEYPSARAAWGDRVLFSPTVGLNDQEVGARWQTVVDLAT